ncbi:MAG: hypothetical protein PQJ49_07300 [Sphaerochaetaceae bacterium]|nr:hypothetical protein [Sphaerochaetaceae bacterium]MDC7238375.1 hypothetical protein [Sphaerochaetaceae bacterium]MDC7249702.1 hypothetical protein [Sphaerochaetaceae bacterium]
MIQIIGFKKCKETQKAIRALKERNIKFQFVDLNERDLSLREWDNIFSHYEGEELINPNSKYYKKKGFSYMVFDAKEELMENSELLITPILRCKNKVKKGYDLETLIKWSE